MKSCCRVAAVTLFGLVLFACGTGPVVPTALVFPTAGSNIAPAASLPPSPTAGPTAAPTPPPLVPDFRHIVIIVFENKEFGTVIASPKMPYFNQLAKSYTLLTQFYAVTRPSLPNYLSMIGGDTFGVTFDCTSCI